MKDVTLCFVSGRGLKDRFIQWVTDCPFNHVYIEFWSDDWGGWQAIDITERGVVQVPASKTGYLDPISRYCANEGMGGAIRARRDLIGNRYDWKGLFGGLFKLTMFKLFGFTISKPWHSKGRLFCSEYVATILGLSDAHRFSRVPWLTTPKDIWVYALCNLDRKTDTKERR